MSKIVIGRKYNKHHGWVQILGTVGYIGITEPGVAALGNINLVDLSVSRNDTKRQGDSFGEIRGDQGSAELYAPVSFTVIEVNSTVINNPSLLNIDPYFRGWILKINITDPAQCDALLDSTIYEILMKGTDELIPDELISIP